MARRKKRKVREGERERDRKIARERKSLTRGGYRTPGGGAFFFVALSYDQYAPSGSK